MKRASGILLHPTSLPGPFGVGDFGGAIEFLNKIAEAGAAWWQVLPLSPPDEYGSPYASISAFALNPTLIDPTPLRNSVSDSVWEDFVDETSLFDEDYFDVASASITKAKRLLLYDAYEQFEGDLSFDQFCADEQTWLDDFALFSAIRTRKNVPWWMWPKPLLSRQESAISQTREQLREEIKREKYIQWIADQQWQQVRAHASELGVQILGDIPIFVSMDSSDVWANRDFFSVTESGKPEHVAGVPPDYFSPTGQKWGNPLYDWDALQVDGYAWWKARIDRVLGLTDCARIDHFRGFSEYWAVPYDAPTAETGEWRTGPRHAFFDFVQETYGDIPFVAEDLGLITDDVIALREAFNLPGMRVMHFAFDDDNADHPFRPHQYPAHCVAYLGTHDNDTTVGWYEQAPESTKHRIRSYFSCENADAVSHMIDALFLSEAELVVVTPQDLLGLGTDARMNAPGQAEGNWSWRLTSEQLADKKTWRDLTLLNQKSNR